MPSTLAERMAARRNRRASDSSQEASSSQTDENPTAARLVAFFGDLAGLAGDSSPLARVLRGAIPKLARDIVKVDEPILQARLRALAEKLAWVANGGEPPADDGTTEPLAELAELTEGNAPNCGPECAMAHTFANDCELAGTEPPATRDSSEEPDDEEQDRARSVGT